MQTTRDLIEIPADVNEQLRVLRQSSDGDPLDSMRRLGELEQYRASPVQAQPAE